MKTCNFSTPKFPQLPLIFFALFFFSSNLLANNQINNGHKVQFSVQKSSQATNDRITLTFRAFAENQNAHQVSNEINRKMQAALRTLNMYPDIKTQTSNYNIHPVYKKQNLSHWRGQQTLTLIFDNQPGLVKVLGQIQKHLTYQNMQFSVSKKRKEKILKQLQSQAILAFRQQAQKIASDFGSNHFKILKSQIRNQGGPSPRPMYARAEMSMKAADSVPNIHAGESVLTVSVDGTILLPN